GEGHFNPAAMLKLLITPFRIGMFSSFAKLVNRHVKDQKLREVLYQYATYAGSSPFRAPATFAVIPHAEMYFGGWYIQGGMYRLAEAMEAVARKLGVEIDTSCLVDRIIVEAPKSRGMGASPMRSLLKLQLFRRPSVTHP